jgi:hypothetical protein
MVKKKDCVQSGTVRTRQKAHAFAKHLEDVFQPHPFKNESEEEEALYPTSRGPLQTRTANQTLQKR